MQSCRLGGPHAYTNTLGICNVTHPRVVFAICEYQDEPPEPKLKHEVTPIEIRRRYFKTPNPLAIDYSTRAYLKSLTRDPKTLNPCTP